MDMTSLSSTLPGSSRQASTNQKQPSPEPNEESLLQAFKSAATSVTLLYKASANLANSARNEGYADALSDILEVIDNEGAFTDPMEALVRIRGWVVDRKQNARNSGGSSSTGTSAPPSAHPQRRQREMSAESEPDEPSGNLNAVGAREPERRDESTATISGSAHPESHSHTVPFSFQPSHPMPQFPANENADDTADSPPELPAIFTFNSPLAPLPNNRVNANRPSGNQNRTLSINNGLGAGAGTKRKNQYVDFFDISGFGNLNNNSNNRDFGNGPGYGHGPGNGGGGGKRGRFV